MDKTEKKAKICLLNMEKEECWEMYNPFKLEMILQECRSQNDRRKSLTRPITRKQSFTQENKISLDTNHRQSLKQLLKKLEELPSPEIPQKKVQKVKTLGAMCTEDPLLEIKQCRVISAKKACNDYDKMSKSKQNKFENCKQRKKIRQEKIRKLIKEKIVEKRQNKQRYDNNKNVLGEYNGSQYRNKKMTFYSKSQTKKLINILI